MGKILDNIIKFLNTASKEEIDKSFEESKKYLGVGISVDEFLKNHPLNNKK